jgi:hypothetical protein
LCKQKKNMKKIFYLLPVLLLFSCTENQRAKSWGGNANLDLPKGEKLVTVTWKESEIWYLTRPMRVDEVAETYKFHESSNFGIMEGTVTIVEHK